VSLLDDLRARDDIVVAATAAVELLLGDDALLTIGQPRETIMGVLRDDQVRAAALTFTIEEGGDGALGFVALEHFAVRVEGAASDEILLTAATPILEAAAQALGALGEIEVHTDAPDEIDLDSLNEAFANTTLVVYPILENTDVVACIAVSLSGVVRTKRSDEAEDIVPALEGAPKVLADVEMGVTAELGRCHMTVRDLMALTPGAVIDLDRAAGAPVDVLVNGTLIARGEVVVMDEEFGIRISELMNGASTR
jgi:flagellar motor switch protein FliN/FliY